MRGLLTPRAMWGTLKDAANGWVDDKAPRMGAALAYYTIFSLAPLLIIAIAIGGAVFGEEAARGQIVGQLRGLVGTAGAEAIETMVENASRPSSSIIATLIAIVVLLFGASGVFVELQSALDTIWKVTPRPGKAIVTLLRERLTGFAMVLGVGFLLLVSLILSAGLEALGAYVSSFWTEVVLLGRILNLVISLSVTTALFALLYKILPGTPVAWRDVWIGAVLAAVFFSIGKFAIGLYLGRSSVASVYGAAGSLVVLLVWTYYSAQILLFGAEITRAQAQQSHPQ
jgi:membrane protein